MRKKINTERGSISNSKLKRVGLLEQALVEEKKIRIDNQENKLLRLNRQITSYDVIKEILPEYKPSPAQEKWHRATQREKGLKGGYGSGKTMAFAAEAIALAYINRPLWIILSSPSEDNALMTVLPHLKGFCERNSLGYSFTKDLGHFEIDFGEKKGNIFLIGQKFVKGPNVAAVGLDEPFSQKKETYDNLIARVRDPKAAVQSIFWAGTAEPDKMEWGHEFFEKDSNTSVLYTLTMSTYQNKYLSKEYLRTLETKYDAKMQEVYLMGKYISLAGGKVYYAFDRGADILTDMRELEIKATDLYQQLPEYIVSFDFNVDPMCAVLLGVYKNTGYMRVIAEEEFKIHNSNTRELCEVIISRLNEKYIEDTRELCRIAGSGRSILITGDASGMKRQTIGQLNDYMIIKDCFLRAGIKHSVYIEPANPAVRDRTNLVNKLFEGKLLKVSSECKSLIKDLELVTWKQGANGFFIDKSKKDLSHLSDAFGYGVWLTQRMFVKEIGDSERVAFKGENGRRKNM